jgi:hypothetical protein
MEGRVVSEQFDALMEAADILARRDEFVLARSVRDFAGGMDKEQPRWSPGDWAWGGFNYWYVRDVRPEGCLIDGWNGRTTAGGWVNEVRVENIDHWQRWDPPESWLAAGRPGAVTEYSAPVGEATIDWDELAAELWDRLPRPIMRADYPGALRAVVGPLLAPAGGETVTVDEAMRISREAAEAVLDAPADTPSGVWYCRTHHGITNEDDPHDAENGDRCDMWDHDDGCVWEDDDHGWGSELPSNCSPCRWVELLVPATTEPEPALNDVREDSQPVPSVEDIAVHVYEHVPEVEWREEGFGGLGEPDQRAWIDAFRAPLQPMLDRLTAADRTIAEYQKALDVAAEALTAAEAVEWVPGWRHVPSGVFSNDTVDDQVGIEQGRVAFVAEGSDQDGC